MKKKEAKKIDLNLPWGQQAEAFLRDQFLPRTNGQAFLVEQFRAATEKAGLSQPADKHAWGGFVQRMKHVGYLRPTGYRTDSYASPKTLWRAA